MTDRNTSDVDRFSILLIEDDPDHAGLIADLLRGDSPLITVTHCPNGPDGLNYLDLCHERGALPDLILLDLNMPGLNGVEVMRIVKSDKRFLHVPAVLLTTSSAPGDVEAAMAAHANSYVCKDIDLDDFETTLAAIRHYWYHVHYPMRSLGRRHEA